MSASVVEQPFGLSMKKAPRCWGRLEVRFLSRMPKLKCVYSTVESALVCEAGDPGSIPGRCTKLW